MYVYKQMFIITISETRHTVYKTQFILYTHMTIRVRRLPSLAIYVVGAYYIIYCVILSDVNFSD